MTRRQSVRRRSIHQKSTSASHSPLNKVSANWPLLSATTQGVKDWMCQERRAGMGLGRPWTLGFANAQSPKSKACSASVSEADEILVAGWCRNATRRFVGDGDGHG